jgi:SAM-dependent methyltransferase
MTEYATGARSGYVLGHSGAEQDRLIRQARLLAPITERLFRQAGIVAGQRVLDIGCGAGDVSILVARLVGDTGEVVGIERDPSTVALARKRSTAQGLRNLTFIEADVNSIAHEGTFDAVVGRLVLNHVRDPVEVLRSVAAVVRPGGAIVFQEGSWGPTFAIGARLPLWSQLLSVVRDTLVRSGLDPERGLDLHRAFEEAGLGRPIMHVEIPLAGDDSVAELQVDLFRTLRSAAEQHGVSLVALGDLRTLADRIHAERVAAHAAVGFLAIVGAWCRLAS